MEKLCRLRKYAFLDVIKQPNRSPNREAENESKPYNSCDRCPLRGNSGNPSEIEQKKDRNHHDRNNENLGTKHGEFFGQKVPLAETPCYIK